MSSSRRKKAMPDEVDYAFHAERLIENPALARALSDEREAILREMHRLETWQTDERWAVSVHLTLIDSFERRLRRMAANKGQIEAFQLKLARSAEQ